MEWGYEWSGIFLRAKCEFAARGGILYKIIIYKNSGLGDSIQAWNGTQKGNWIFESTHEMAHQSLGSKQEES